MCKGRMFDFIDYILISVLYSVLIGALVIMARNRENNVSESSENRQQRKTNNGRSEDTKQTNGGSGQCFKSEGECVHLAHLRNMKRKFSQLSVLTVQLCALLTLCAVLVGNLYLAVVGDDVVYLAVTLSNVTRLRSSL